MHNGIAAVCSYLALIRSLSAGGRMVVVGGWEQPKYSDF
jgi:hypothetical protein